MYKILIFLKKTEEEKVIDHFKNFILKYFSELTGKNLDIGLVESNPLLETKFTHFIEINFESKEKWEKLLGSEKGESLEQDLIDFHNFISIIFVNYEHISDSSR